MLVIPAIELRDGGVVEPEGGDSLRTEVRFGDPRDVAHRWAGYGFTRLHVMDLDAELQREANRSTVRDILADAAASIQVGGGVHTNEEVERLLSDGASFVIVGARALVENDWLREIAESHAGCIILSAVVRDRRVMSQSWAREFPRDILDLVGDLADLPLGAILVSASQAEGVAARPDLQLLEDIAEASKWPVLASGIVETMADLRALEERGLAGAVVGNALYSGSLDPRVLVEEFAA